MAHSNNTVEGKEILHIVKKKCQTVSDVLLGF